MRIIKLGVSEKSFSPFDYNYRMDISDKHPVELTLHQMIKEVKNLLEKYENQYLDGEEREVLTKEFNDIKQKLFDLQMKRFTQYINDRGKVENLPKEEERLQKGMTDLTMRINKLLYDN